MIFLGPEDTQRTWSPSQKSHEAVARVEGTPWGAPLPCAPLGDPLTYFFVLYIHIYSRTLRESHENNFPPSQVSDLVRSHLEAFAGTLPEGDLIVEGIYINPIALPMKHE